MTRYTPTDIGDITTATAQVNTNFDDIKASNDRMLSRYSGDDPNTMQTNIDMNSNRITNLPAPVSNNEPARYGDIIGYVSSASASAIAAATSAAQAVAAAALGASPITTPVASNAIGLIKSVSRTLGAWFARLESWMAGPALNIVDFGFDENNTYAQNTVAWNLAVIEAVRTGYNAIRFPRTSKYALMGQCNLPSFSRVTLSLTTSSGSTPVLFFTSQNTVWISNSGTRSAYLKFGSSDVVASASNYDLLIGPNSANPGGSGAFYTIPDGCSHVAGLGIGGNVTITMYENDDQAPARPFRVLGAGNLRTKLKLADPSARYLFGHSSYLFLPSEAVPMTQLGGLSSNSFVEIADMDLLGLQTLGKDAPLIAVANTWTPRFRDLYVGGCPAGPALLLWSRGAGGTQTGEILRVKDKKANWDTITVGTSTVKLHNINAFRDYGQRYMIHLFGPDDANGKTNNIAIRDCESYLSLIGMVDTKGFNAVLDTSNDVKSAGPPIVYKTDQEMTGFPWGGGVDWVRLEGNFYGGENIRKIEDDTIVTINSQTDFTLSSTYVNGTNGQYNNYILRLTNPTDGLQYSRRILSTSSNNRRVTIDRAFPWTVTGTPAYNIAYADVQFWTDGGHPDTIQHMLRWCSWLYAAVVSNNRTEESVPVVKLSTANDECVLINNHQWTDQSRGYQIWDTTYDSSHEFADEFSPLLRVGHKPRAYTGAAANFVAQYFLAHGANTANSPTGYNLWRTNNSGASLNDGDIVQIDPTNGQRVIASADISVISPGMHAMVITGTGKAAQNGKQTGIMALGIGKPNIYVTANQVVNADDVLIPITGNVCIAKSYRQLTALEARRAIGRVITPFTNGATPQTVSSIQCWISPQPVAAGTGWQVIGASGVANTQIATDTNEHILGTVTIPGGFLGPNGILRFTALWSYTNSAATKTPRTRLGGLTGASIRATAVTTTATLQEESTIQNRNSQSSQVAKTNFLVGFGSSTGLIVTSTKDTSVDQDLVFTAQHAAITAEVITLESFFVEGTYRP